jgi:hypothetical protein
VNRWMIQIVLGMLLGTGLHGAQRLALKTVVVILDKTTAGFVYTVDGIKTPLPAMLTRLAEKIHGLPPPPNAEVRLLVTEEANLGMIDNFRGIASKAGYSSTRVFYFRPDKRYMFELTSNAVPFSSTGKLPGEP